MTGRGEHGPFDVIGDVHGCCDELEELLGRLGYKIVAVAPGGPWLISGVAYAHPEGRKAVFVGDLVDRGPRILDTLRLVATMVAHGSALCVPGNHDMKLLKKLRGKDVQITHGLAETLAEIDAQEEGVRGPLGKDLADFLDRPDQPLRPRRRQARGRPRRDEGRDAGPGIGQGPGLRPLRRDDRRDR